MAKSSSPARTGKVRSQRHSIASDSQRFRSSFSGYPVSVSGMITLPVSSSVYQSMVANIQQIHTNGDGTLCITPMQVHKNGVQNNGIVNTSCTGNSSISSTVNSVCSSVSSSAMLLNSGNQFTGSSVSPNANNNSNNLLELCRALNQTTQYPKNVNFNSVAMNRNKARKHQIQMNPGSITSTICHQTNLSHEINVSGNSNNNNVPMMTNNNIKFSTFSSGVNNSVSANQNQNGNPVINENATQPIKMECEVDIA